MIDYTLLPLYDPSLPLESFMSDAQASTFRAALRGATEAAWSDNQVCTSTCSGLCKPLVDLTAFAVGYPCTGVGNVDAQLPAPLSAAEKARQLTPRVPISASAMLPVASLQLLQVRINGTDLALSRVVICKLIPPKTFLVWLQLGFNSFLGLSPQEQSNDFTRQRIFELHEDPANSFMVRTKIQGPMRQWG